ncbi:MAG: sensor histidine kinase, partial [Gemmatimonas sp.]
MSWWTRTPPPEGDRPPHVSWRLFVLLFGASTVLRFAYFYLDDLTRQLPGTFVPRLIEEGTGNFASALLFPIALLAERYFPVDGGRWRRNAFVHVLGYIAYSTAHTTVIALTRPPIFAAAGLGHYDYGLMSVRYFMESAQDAFSYATFLGILTLMRVNARLRERDVRAAQLERDAVSARLESLSLRLQPHFLFNALNMISSTVYEDPVAADELIGRLGELLRESLSTTDRQEISLGEELEVLRAYLSFVDARFGDRVK